MTVVNEGTAFQNVSAHSPAEYNCLAVNAKIAHAKTINAIVLKEISYALQIVVKIALKAHINNRETAAKATSEISTEER